VLITGAAAGIGAATARYLAGRGARLILIDRDGDRLDGLAADLANAAVETHTQDVGDEAGWHVLAGRLGPLDHVVANAGIAASGPVGAIDLADWRRVMAINLDGVFLTLKHGLAALRRGAPRARSMVVVASAAGVKPMAQAPAYATSKAAIIHLAKCVALDAAADGIRVNVICPGGVKTDIWAGYWFEAFVAEKGSREAAFAAMAETVPLRQFAEPAAIAAHIAFLLSEGSALMTGAVQMVDGGYAL
jgi:NAD(P)-dependent dehydrogenase (short-subunit alcohol dehydrogenase family)